MYNINVLNNIQALYIAHQSLKGFIVGNNKTSLIESLSVSSITNLSSPIPKPPVGGKPYSRAVTKSSSTLALVGPAFLRCSTCLTKRSFWSIGSFSSENAFPNSQQEMKYSNLSVNAGSSDFLLARGEISTG